MIRFDREKGKQYTYYNIPIDGRTTSIQNSKGFFKIMSESHNHPEDCWFNGRFIGDRYAVFQWNELAKFYQQVSVWYSQFGKAVRKLEELAKE